MFTTQRVITPAINAALITGGLIYLMFLMVKTTDPELSIRQANTLPPMWSVRDEVDPVVLVAPPSKPPEVAISPQLPRSTPLAEVHQANDFAWAEPTFERVAGGSSALTTTQLVLALGYPPVYPRRAIEKGIEGYAIVGFTVSAAGAVVAPFIIESAPNSVFDRASLAAISKFKYQPRVADGKPVATPGQRYMFSYRLDEQ